MSTVREKLRNRNVALGVAGVLLIVSVVIGAGAGYAYSYRSDFYYGVSIGGIDVSGMSFKEGSRVVNAEVDRIIADGAVVSMNGSERVVPLRFLSPDDPDASRDLVIINVDDALKEGFAIGRSGGFFRKAWEIFFVAGFQHSSILAEVQTDEEAIGDGLLEQFAEYYDPAQEPSFEMSYVESEYTKDTVVDGKNVGDSYEELVVGVSGGSDGRVFDVEQASLDLKERLASLRLDVLDVDVIDDTPEMSREDALAVVDLAAEAVEGAPYGLFFESDQQDEFEYFLSAEQMMVGLTPVFVDGEVRLGLNDELDEYFEQIASEIDILPQDARFRMEDEKVVEFKPSQFGRAMDVDATKKAVGLFLAGGDEVAAYVGEAVDNVDEVTSEAGDGGEAGVAETDATAAGGAGVKAADGGDPADGDGAADDEVAADSYDGILIVVNETNPDVSTASVNDLGIDELLGVGVSEFHHSSRARIKNISNGSSLLNGVLVAPGEEFSAIKNLDPITYANGYVQEAIIKGDEIKYEVGGGLCQIGSTIFRAAMNSGLEITERRNHSLVVSYYNDLTNGNPGTDATLYGPHPDLRFVNDTDHYILITTEIDVPNVRLTYKIWGTSDGRNGYYTPPVVHNWFGGGAKKTVYTNDLTPGKKKCQGAFPGANTSFEYYIERADGEVDHETFSSHYKALPTICMIGLKDGESVGPDGELIPAPEPDPEVLSPSGSVIDGH